MSLPKPDCLTPPWGISLMILIAITGRAPNTSTHLPAVRRAQIVIDVDRFPDIDDAFYSSLGYLIGKLTPNNIPAITGLEELAPTRDDLKSFGAAFATTSAVPMFHVIGITPEAPTLAAVADTDTAHLRIDRTLLNDTWRELNSADTREIDLVALGNPHFSIEECERLAALCEGNLVHERVTLAVTCARETLTAIRRSGVAASIEASGATLIADTCWCLIGSPIVPVSAYATITNSGKYARYGPNETGRSVHLRSLTECAEAAWSGLAPEHPPAWLT
ncbi:MAG: aconitase X [Beutenbergiaceae bacterium]